MARKENPNQLRMFMTPEEIMASYEPNPGDFAYKKEKDPKGGYVSHRETTDEFWGRKLKESNDIGLTSSIAERGVEVPVSLSHSKNYATIGDLQGFISGGHHRIAAAHKLNPHQFIPVMYNDSVWDANYAENEIMYQKGNEHLDFRF